MAKIELKGAREIRALPSRSQELLLDFLRDWLSWATTVPLTEKYFPANGLCLCVVDYVHGATERFPVSFRDIAHLQRALEIALAWPPQGHPQTRLHPFGAFNYAWRSALHRQHKCRKRLAWVRAVIEVLEEQE